MEKEICGCCGERIENEEIKQNYEKHDLEPELRFCENCLREQNAVDELLEKIKESLGTENAEDWENMERSLKSAFALQQIKTGNIQGGTVGHIETLRAITASEIA